MKIGGLQKTTLIDYPGRPAATIFLCGCNFRCPWCYSRELVLPEEIKRQPEISEENLFAFLRERRGFLGGIVICGGEPTIHKELPEFIEKIKNLGYLIKLDTNGSNPKILKQLIDEKKIDYAAMDIKLPKDKYQELLGVDPGNIEESVRIIKSSGVDYEFRTTVIPTIHKKEDIVKIAKWLTPAKKYYLQNFRPEKTIDPEFEKLNPFSEEYLLEIKEITAPYFEFVQTR